MRLLGVLCCLATLLASAASGFRQSQACRSLAKLQQREKEGGFFDNLPERRYGELGRFTELVCCATNFDSLTWKFNGVSLSEWSYSQSENTYIELRGDLGNQSLYLRSVQFDMQGTYTCELTKGSDKLYHTINFFVHPTVQYVGPALMTLTPHDQYANIGDNVTFACEGWFGSSRQPFVTPSNVMWSVQRSNNQLSLIVRFPRYFVQKTTSESRLYKKSILKVYNVHPEDYGVRFNCLVSNSVRGPDGYANKTVTILRPF